MLLRNYKLKIVYCILASAWLFLFYRSYSGTIEPQVQLTILLFSSPENHLRRATIRSTWLSVSPPYVKHFFSIGTRHLSQNILNSLAEENNQYGDLLLLDIDDDYENLSTKLMESIHAVKNRLKFEYFFKGDDDTFVNLKELISELSSKRKNRLYWGFFDGRATVKKAGKWMETGWVLCDRYLPHARGGGYIISSDLVNFISTNMEYFKKYRSEDISMGAWLAAVDIERLHDPRFDTEYKSRGCNNHYLVTHKVSIEEMRRLHENLQNLGTLCEREIRLRNSYVYNWKVPPSECCVRNDSSIP